MKLSGGDAPSPRASHLLCITTSIRLTCSQGPFLVAFAGGRDPCEPLELQPCRPWAQVASDVPYKRVFF